jgi:hypothetical protein
LTACPDRLVRPDVIKPVHLGVESLSFGSCLSTEFLQLFDIAADIVTDRGGRLRLKLRLLLDLPACRCGRLAGRLQRRTESQQEQKKRKHGT